MERCRDGLSRGENGESGLLVIKENVNKFGVFFDDISFCRTVEHYEIAFEAAGLEIVHSS